MAQSPAFVQTYRHRPGLQASQRRGHALAAAVVDGSLGSEGLPKRWVPASAAKGRAADRLGDRIFTRRVECQ